MTDYSKIIRRTNIQEMRSLFLEGLDLASYSKEPDTADYEERLRSREKPLMDYIENLYPDGPVRDAVFELVSNAVLANQEVYTELGMRLGAQAIFELLQHNPLKELSHGEINKEG